MTIIDDLEAVVEKQERLLRIAELRVDEVLHELGVPTDDYPAPVANAVDNLSRLKVLLTGRSTQARQAPLLLDVVRDAEAHLGWCSDAWMERNLRNSLQRLRERERA